MYIYVASDKESGFKYLEQLKMCFAFGAGYEIH